MRQTCLALVASAVIAPIVLAQQAGPDTAREIKVSRPKTFHVEQRAGTNQVTVESKSTLSDFTNLCNQVVGDFQFDPGAPEGFTGQFRMPVTGIHTGIGLRDRHLRSADWLDADRYPDIIVTLTQARDVRKESVDSVTMTLVGTCGMHGVTRDIQVPATLTCLGGWPTATGQAKGEVVSIQAAFEVRISDYGIKGARTLGLKVADIQRVRVSIFGVMSK